jgi:hypothetical protein
MKNEVRRGISVIGGLVFAFLSYEILVLFIDGSFLWALVLGVLIYSIVAIDKSILEGDNRRMLNEKLTVEVGEIENRCNARRFTFKDKRAEVLDKKAEVLDKKAEVMKKKAEVLEEEAEVKKEEKVVRKEEEKAKKKVARK